MVTLTAFPETGGTITEVMTEVFEVRRHDLGWNNLLQLQISATDDPGLDNIEVTRVPEPAGSVLLFLTLGWTFALRQRRGV